VKAITVHGRTRQQFYKGPADWGAVAEVKQATSLPVIVNGDVIDLTSARDALAQSGADAIMIGRASMAGPGSLPCWTARCTMARESSNRMGGTAAHHPCAFSRQSSFLRRRAGTQGLPQTSRLVCRKRACAS